MAKWQSNGELTPRGERLTDAYLEGERGGALEALFPNQPSNSLERMARSLIRQFELREQEIETNEDLPLVESVTEQPVFRHFDLETTNFDPTYGVILMMAWSDSNEDEVHLLSIDDYDVDHLPPFERDKPLLMDIVKALEAGDGNEILSGHYSKAGKFDVSFINTRLVYYGLPPLQDMDHLDTQQLFASIRGKTRASSGLKNISQFLNPEEEQKSGVGKQTWYNAQHGWVPALEELKEYCKQDVITQKAILPKVLPFARAMNIPGYQIIMDKERLSCVNPTCGSEDIEHVGWKNTRVMKYKRYKCSDCGMNMRGRNSVMDRNTPRLTT